jgi:4-hydroxybenzoate polyprenyltransferase
VLLEDPPHPTRVSTVRGLALATHPGPALAVTAMAGVLGLAVGLDAGRIALLVAAVLTGQLSIGWSNDLLDLGRDRRAGRADKPLATGAVSPSVVRRACGAALVLTVVLSLMLGWLPGLTQLVVVAGGWAYNLGLKATAASWVPYAVAFGALPAVPPLVAGADVDWRLPTVGALLGMGAHLLNVLPDLDDDRATGVAGLPHRLAARSGPRAVAALAVGLFVVATVLLVTLVPFGPVVAVACGLVVASAVAALLGSGRTPFRAAIAIALVCVVLLAVAA